MIRPLGAPGCPSSKPKLGTRNLAWKEISSSGGELFPKLNQKLGWIRKLRSPSLAERGGFIFDADTRWWYISDWWNISNLYAIAKNVDIFKTKYTIFTHFLTKWDQLDWSWPGICRPRTVRDRNHGLFLQWTVKRNGIGGVLPFTWICNDCNSILRLYL